MTHAKIKRRPRWDRILIALLILGLCVGLSIGLTRLLTEQPEELDATGGDSTSGGLQISANPGGGQVLSFTDPGVSLDGLRYTKRIDQDSAFNEQYAYFCLHFDENDYQAGSALARFDYSTRTLDWLCDTPGCDHTSPECTAWLPQGVRSIYLDDDKLYYRVDDWENGICQLYQSDLDGGNRSEIMHIEEETLFPDVVFNDEAVVLISSGNGATAAQAYVYNKAGGSFQPYMSMKSFVPIGIYQTIYDRYLTTVVEKTDGVLSYIAIDLATGQERNMCDFVQYTETEDRTDKRYFAMPVEDNGYLYYLRDKEGDDCDFVRQSIATGEETVLNGSVYFPDDHTAGQRYSVENSRYMYSIMPMSDKGNVTDCCLDLATGALVPPAAQSASCFPVAQFGEYYLAQKVNDATIDLRDFRLITRADYEAGNENYLPIQDNTR